MQTSTPQVLFVDDDERALRSLLRSLKQHSLSFDCHAAHDAEEAYELFQEFMPAVAVVDLTIDPSVGPDSGLELISKFIHRDHSARILVLTGHDSSEMGLRALHYGAASFLQKPADPKHLLALIRDGITFAQLKRKLIAESIESNQGIQGLSSVAPSMKPILESCAYAASNKQPLLLCGETGTGKGVTALAIHNASERQSAPFIRFQPSFGSHDLISSELFGHQKGAFTGASEPRRGLLETVEGGTLFIDEVDELPLETQITLLDVLQEHTFRPLGSNREIYSDFRLITATNRKIDGCLKTGKLRQDFYHRIAHFTIDLPALRERKEDIEELALEFLHKISNREKLSIDGISDKSIAKLYACDWPGNIRQLQATIEGGAYRAVFNSHRNIEPDDIDIEIKNGEFSSGISFRDKVRNYELRLVQEAIAKHNGNQSQAAASLKMDRSTLRRILERVP